MKQLEIAKARKSQTYNNTLVNKEKLLMKKKQDVDKFKEDLQVLEHFSLYMLNKFRQ